MNIIGITQKLEEAGVDPDKIDEVAHYIDQLESKQIRRSPAIDSTIISNLEIELLNEPDWKKRAAIAAKIISINLS